jgi:hypothetical protein
MGDRPTYAPIPARAFGDDRLSGTDLRLLAAIAAHDRFGKNGAGCFASQRRLASLVNAHEKAVARSAGRLFEFGYLTVEKNPMNGRLVVYRVIYNEEDSHAMRGDGRSFTKAAGLTLAPAAPKIGDSAVTEFDAGTRSPRPANSSKSVTDPPPRVTVEKAESGRVTGSIVVTDQGPTGNSLKKEAQQNQCDTPYNIFCEAEDKRLREARDGRQSEAICGPRPPGVEVGEARLWKAADESLSPAEQAALLRRAGEGVRPSGALLALQAALGERGAA